ncbi:60s acidic ribosomal protein p2 [Lasius niger]|uniref:60s acidic ribosomal protein p2 n=1 Tax=Lasius niger TaxID=67767 RepID=A0A0J7LA02_LASNI|nr:60s acidic ribosomal protein p2 [Lasius niger]
MNRSLNFDVISPRKDNLLRYPSSNLDNDSYDAAKSDLRDLSRSAKIMRALSFNRDSFYQGNMDIKKSLNFDSPSPQKTSNFDMSSPADSITDTSSPMLDKPLRLDSSSNDSATSSMLASLESIDENQNQTPQQNRKISKMSSNRRINTEENANESGSSCSTSSLRSNLKERIDNILHTSQTPDLHSFRRENRSETPGCVIVASTPRNLFQEFNQDAHNRSHTPDNMMNLIPESMSAIKKSHKKEKLHGHEERSFTQQKNVPATNEDTHTSMLESIAADMSAIASCSGTFVKESQRKNKSVKKTLFYDSDDELSETELVLEHGAQQKITSREKDFLKNRLDEMEDDKIHNIDSSDCERCEENMQQGDSTHFTNYDDKKEDHSAENICDKDIFRPSSQKRSLNTCNVNVMDGNRTVSPEPNSTVSQDSNGAATPENNINILEHVFTESIKKSHKKIKHENRKTKLKAKILYQNIETAQLEISAQDTFNEQCKDVKNEATVATCDSLSSQNADRPSTPENINSSRLLLSEFKSVKKSHKKDKCSKRISGLAKCHKYHEYRKRYDDTSLQDNRYEERNTSKILHGNDSLELNESLDVSPKKKKKSMNVSFESGVRKLYSSKSPSLRCNNTNDEFKIYTPARKVIPTSRFTVTNCVCADGMSQEKDEPAQTTSKEIDCSRCMTPVARCLKKLRENEDLTYASFKILETDASVSSDGPADVADLKDENGRSTPINMSTTELLCNIDSIKKSHKKDKNSRSICKRPVSSKKESYVEETETVNFTSMLKQHTSLQHMDVDIDCVKTGMCSNTRDEEEKEESKCCEEIIYDDPQPSTSRARDSIDVNTIKKSELNTTPPNNSNTTNFIKLLHTISIKKSHKKERNCNAQAKYILMNEEHELSDDGSIFDEEDKLNFSEN